MKPVHVRRAGSRDVAEGNVREKNTARCGVSSLQRPSGTKWEVRMEPAVQVA